MSIKERYKPYNYSSTRCHVIRLDFSRAGRYGIEAKLPAEIERLKGIYFTSFNNSPLQMIGSVFLTFNNGALKMFQLYIPNTKIIMDFSHPLPVDEEIKSNSLMQGHYHIRGEGAINPRGYVKIYLHYEPRKSD